MWQGYLQILLTLAIVVAITPWLGNYMAEVFLGNKTFLSPWLNPVENALYSWIQIRPQQTMTGWQYIAAILYSNLVMGIGVLAILLLQNHLPFNGTELTAPSWDLALHTTISFLTNTDQQHYSGEITLSYASQVFAIGFLMFTSAGTGLSVGIAFIRGLTGRNLGNFYQDLILSITRILLPLAIPGALLLLLSGVPETWSNPVSLTTLEGNNQVIALGPVAHYEIIKQLGENGGGFFGTNSAHPFENPNGFSNLLQTIAMLSVPTALIYTYGIFAKNKRQAWLIFGMVLAIFLGLISVTAIAEFQGNHQVNLLLDGIEPNLEGKEVRFGWSQTALFIIATTATMCGAVNGLLDSFMPAGGFSTLFNLFLQVIWGGQGTGTAYLFVYLILAVFITGLMVGRTPEFLGRKIEKSEIVLASIILLIHPIAVLIPAAIALAFPSQLAGISNSGFHGISQVVYEYASASANNGSGLEGLDDNTLWWNLSTCFSLVLGRYIPIVALLLLADRLSQKQPVPLTAGTLRTDTILFTSVTAGIILILGALTFFPVLVLGPIAEAFTLQ
ncbi:MULTISPECIES: potassium-transporting ATPase subunit KdpA [unclassified Synechocystis]|uniref:potassium-transporting ATPase subunit KdpA n=1 Tax=unclassified Synechocystis TaxID=2640012 RepID=UPI0004019C9C|nr:MULTISPECIES: potassium-transporting ATPase subunit KdpA [unclassified Synechocystis]AIE74236.1 Potassium-transporting ATPase A chain [Synechocystis sp. PCC 6714]MCT0252864.1 potassium-transporting ATPase subunit KdpA [Synechocystis sp. CS-94]